MNEKEKLERILWNQVQLLMRDIADNWVYEGGWSVQKMPDGNDIVLIHIPGASNEDRTSALVARYAFPSTIRSTLRVHNKTIESYCGEVSGEEAYVWRVWNSCLGASCPKGCFHASPRYPSETLCAIWAATLCLTQANYLYGTVMPRLTSIANAMVTRRGAFFPGP